MAEDYLKGAIAQAIERARVLSVVVDQPYASTYDGLRTICSERLRQVLTSLRQLEAETIVDESLQTPRRLRMYRRVVEHLRSIETIGATALANAGSDATELTTIVRTVCDDLRYPLIPPTVANTSSSYLSIYAGFNLMMVPLLEGRFLLHLPDLFHELAHPFLDPHYDDRPTLDPYRASFRLAILRVKVHFQEARLVALRERAAADLSIYLHVWERHWTNYWLEEFFCDAFGALTCGPAYGWAHYHLCAKTAESVYQTTFGPLKTHPADDSRMRLICQALRTVGFVEDAESIQFKWNALVGFRGDDRLPEYQQCYPDELIAYVVDAVWNSINDMNVTLAVPGAMTEWPDRLNSAWTSFWDKPEAYGKWESDALKLAKAGAQRL